MQRQTRRGLLPEEDAIDDSEEDDEADPTLPGDLWYLIRQASAVLPLPRRSAK